MIEPIRIARVTIPPKPPVEAGGLAGLQSPKVGGDSINHFHFSSANGFQYGGPKPVTPKQKEALAAALTGWGEAALEKLTGSKGPVDVAKAGVLAPFDFDRDGKVTPQETGAGLFAITANSLKWKGEDFVIQTSGVVAEEHIGRTKARSPLGKQIHEALFAKPTSPRQ